MGRMISILSQQGLLKILKGKEDLFEDKKEDPLEHAHSKILL